MTLFWAALFAYDVYATIIAAHGFCFYADIGLTAYAFAMLIRSAVKS